MKAVVLLSTLALAACARFAPARDPSAVSLGLTLSETLDAWHGEAFAEQALDATHWATGGMGLSLFMPDTSRLYGGLDVRLRVNVPARISPYAGVGLFLGSWPYPLWDDDEDRPHPSERIEREYLLATYPEIGLHLWLSDQLRVSAHARYYYSTLGREGDGAFYGFAVGGGI